ncbi:MAG: histidinol dehydrogenase [Gemmatimonadaceae bacterium]
MTVTQPGVLDANLVVRFSGCVRALATDDQKVFFERTGSGDDVREHTAAIVARVRDEGDSALFALAEKWDGVRLERLEVPRIARRRALDNVEPALRRAMTRAADNIARTHRAFLPHPIEFETEPGIIVGRRPDPLRCVGVYAPGGRAVYPSSVLMGAVPARVAGVSTVVLCSPPRETGFPAEVVLAAAELAGVDRVFAIGGAGAIAAMAYGTTSVPRVDRILGPGNAYVAEAKLQLSSVVGIDSPAGPSELLVIGDQTADPELIAREMLAQAEHDPRAAIVAIVVGERLASVVTLELARLLPRQQRAGICRAALQAAGGVLWANDLDEAVAFANEYAAEHLLLLVSDLEGMLARLRNVGTVFLGPSSSVVFGDYMTGANHVLPTGGLARAYSGLSILDFMRWTTYQRVSQPAAARMASDVGIFADSERLPGHAAAARAWAAREQP